MEAGHGKGSCDPIGDVAKQKADRVVKNGKYVIQDAMDLFDWSKEDTSAIAFSYVSIEDCGISVKFLKGACENLQAMKVHAVFSRKVNSIWVRDTSCFCKNCFSLKFQKDSRCKGWREYLLATSTKNQRKDEPKKNSDQNKEPSRVVIEDSQSTSIVPEPNDYVAAIYSGKPCVGQVEKTDEEDEEAHINFLEHKGNLQRGSKFNKPKKKIKYGFLFLISFVLFHSLQILKGLLKFAQKYLIIL